MPASPTFTKEYISTFLKSIAEEYSLDEDKLISSFDEKIKINKNAGKGKRKSNESKEPKEVSSGELTDDILNSSTCEVLKEFCRNRKLKVSGNKAVLIARLKGQEVEVSPKKGVSKEKTGAGKKKKVVNDKEAIKIEEKSKILDKIKDMSTSIQARRNQFGNLTHAETGLVFQKINGDNQVVGRQADDGSILNLCKEDIQNCKKFKFLYVQLPSNLDSKKEEDEDEEIIEDEMEEEEDYEEEEEEEEE